MLKEAQNLSASGLGQEKYKDVGTIQLIVEDIVEAIEASEGGSYSLQKDKSGELTLCENNGSRIKPLLCLDANRAIKHYLPNDFHKQYAVACQILEDREKVKLPTMDTTKTIFPPTPA